MGVEHAAGFGTRHLPMLLLCSALKSYVMLCCALLCYATLCYALQCFALLSYAMQCCLPHPCNRPYSASPISKPFKPIANGGNHTIAPLPFRIVAPSH